jgi:hypothetical protein
MGAGLRDAPAWAVHAWRFSGRVLSKTPDEVTLELTWQRVLDHGNASTATGSPTQLTLRLGEAVTLETVEAPADSECSRRVSFEARYGSKPYHVDVVATGSGASKQEVRRGTGVGAGSGTAAGGGVSGVSRGAAAGGVSGARMPSGSRWMDVNLWLVHSAPGRQESVLHQQLRAPLEGADFAFAPMSIETPRGPAIVQVRGSLSVTDGQQLIFVTNRTVKFRSPSARESAFDTQGGGRTVNAMPGPAEVLSFDMPPILGPQGSGTLPDQFSVRVQIIPR